MRRMAALFMLCLFCVSFIGCATIKVGGNAQLAPSSSTGEKVASKKVWYLLGGLIPLTDNTTDSIVPQNSKVRVETKFTFVDLCIQAITGGLITAKTAEVYQIK